MVKSMKPGKQRKAFFNAPMHEKRKRLSARLLLDKPDSRFDGVRNVTIRVRHNGSCQDYYRSIEKGKY